MFIVCYDVSCDRRRRQLENQIRPLGTRMQRSVFMCHVSENKLSAFTVKAKDILNEEEDRLSIYYVCQKDRKRIKSQGKEIVVEGSRYWCV